MEYLATGIKPVYESPPITVKVVKKVDQVKVVEKVVEKPVIHRTVRVKYRRNPVEYAAAGLVCFVVGLVIGILI